ncbi:MAG TPA: AI-2E family transporter [Vicinamibacterales bacterium]|nr:AI-2E family transporter [Vicinamibacterales bacterium]
MPEPQDSNTPETAERPAAERRPRAGQRTAMTIMAIIAVLFLLKYAQDVFIPLVLAGLLFYALAPVVDGLQKLRVPRALASALVLLTLLGGLVWTTYSVRDEAISVIENLPKAARNLRTALRPGKGEPESTIGKIQKAATELDKTTAEAIPPPPTPEGVVRVQVEEPTLGATEFVRWGSTQIVSMVSQGLMVLLLAFFLLLADDLLKRKLLKNFGTSLSRKKITIQILNQIGTQVGRFLLVQLSTSALVAVVTGLALWWLGLEQAMFWGIAAGLLNAIPYMGPIIVTTCLGMVGFMQFGTLSMAMASGGIALLITTLEGWFLTPSLLGKAAQMNQVAVFISLILWSWLWGTWGVFLAVPMMMVIKAVCDHVDDLKPWGEFLGE